MVSMVAMPTNSCPLAIERQINNMTRQIKIPEPTTDTKHRTKYQLDFYYTHLVNPHSEKEMAMVNEMYPERSMAWWHGHSAGLEQGRKEGAEDNAGASI